MAAESIIGSSILKAIASKIALESYDLLKGYFTNNSKSIVEDLPELIENHMTEVVNWVSSIQMLNMPNAKSIDEQSIELMLNGYLRRQGAVSGDKFLENDVLRNENNYVILGDPGAGKTTTIKRLIKSMLDPNSNEDIPYAFPILVVLRSIKESKSLLKVIANSIGLPTNETKENNITETKIGNTDIIDALAQFLSHNKAIIFLDGLDELDLEIRKKFILEIEKLSLKLFHSKIILTTRTSDYDKTIQNFVLCEVEPLNEDQIKVLASKWVINYSKFLSELKSKPYADVLNRPLFLTYLLTIFEANGALPNQPSQIYRLIILLALKKWDDDRDIERRSKYGINFDYIRKLDFLSEIAYQLTYQIGGKQFSRSNLIRVYNSINEKYELPAEEYLDVIKEIESHNGIINVVNSYTEVFEFSHLSLQEYLCASFLSKQTFSSLLYDYFRDYPEPLAIAVAEAQEPSQWFSILILNSQSKSIRKSLGVEQHYRLLSRLITEKPRFQVLEELGHALIYLASRFSRNSDFDKFFIFLLNDKNVKKSILLALSKYVVKRKEYLSYSDGSVQFSLVYRVLQIESKHPILFPQGGYVRSSLLSMIGWDFPSDLLQ